MRNRLTYRHDDSPADYRRASPWTTTAAITIALIATGFADVDPARGSGTPSELEALPQAQRIEAIGYRISESNANLCQRARPLLGMRLRDLSRYNASDRAMVQAAYGIGMSPAIEWVVPGSAAADVGLSPGDVILVSGATSLEAYRTDLVKKSASYDRVAAIEKLLEDQILAGVGQLTVRKHDGMLETVILDDRRGCISRFLVVDDKTAGAWSDEFGVEVTSGLVELARNDDAIAFVIAHEMAHIILCHTCRHGSSFLAKLGIGSKSWRAAELSADELAIDLVVGARYNPYHAIDLMRSLDKKGLGRRTGTHPIMSKRIENLERILAEKREGNSNRQ